MSYCGSGSLVKLEPTQRTAKVLRCRCWSCETCAPDRRRRLIREGHGGRPDTFITLTVRWPFPGGAIAAAKALTRAWQLLHKRALREAVRDVKKTPLPSGRCPPRGWWQMRDTWAPRQVRLTRGRLPYLTVMERTEQGAPHLHILLRSKWVDQGWASEQMRDLLNSPVVSVERVTTKSKAVAYVTKYCGKDPFQFGTCKRYYKSKDYELDRRWLRRSKQPGAGETYRSSLALWQHEMMWRRYKWTIIVNENGSITGIYPQAAKTGPP